MAYLGGGTSSDTVSVSDTASVRFFKRLINPSFKNRTNVVMPSPSETAPTDCKEVVERNVELRWGRRCSLSEWSRAQEAADLVAEASAHFPVKEQQSV